MRGPRTIQRIVQGAALNTQNQSAGESPARQRCRERRRLLLRWRCLLLRRCSLLRRRRGLPVIRIRRCDARALAFDRRWLVFVDWFRERLRIAGRGSRCWRARGFRRRRRSLDHRRWLLMRALVHVPRYALFDTRNAFREYRPALTRNFLLGVEPIQGVGRVEVAAGTTGKRDRNRGKDGGSNQALRAAHRCLASAFRGRRQQGLQRLSAAAQARRRAGIVADHVEPLAGCRCIVGAVGRQGK